MRSMIAGMVAAGILAATPAGAQVGTAVVNTQWSVYLAGGNAYGYVPPGGGGIAPPAVAIDPGTGRVLTVNATGTSAFCGAGVCVAGTPDGPAIAGTNVLAAGAISGIVAPTSGFLAGVFLGSSLPGSAPSTLDFVALTTNFTTLAPGLGQVFFIGDGANTGGTTQQFLVPDGATRLFFGIADASGFNGPPAFYDDNVGSYTAAYQIAGASVVPEPATVLLLGSGLLVLGVAGRRLRG